jgi:hypothetical protein
MTALDVCRYLRDTTVENLAKRHYKDIKATAAPKKGITVHSMGINWCAKRSPLAGLAS